jgi:predicted DsbA family dithiol-disulfide isomerase
MQVDIWSDVVCPWCYIGKRRFETALARFSHADQVQVVWHSFELDPHATASPAGSIPDRLAAKYGISREQAIENNRRLARLAAAEGLDYAFDRAQPGNTFDAHRLLHLAREQGKQAEVKERLFRAYFTQGEPIGDQATLLRLATEAGLGEDDARRVLESQAYADEVRADERLAAELGITGVPFFVLDMRYGVSGAQPADLLLSALERTWAERQPPVPIVSGGETCTDESCSS